MGDRSNIEWTDATWNPIRGCSRVSEGCRHCYAETVAARFSGPGQPYEGLARFVGRPHPGYPAAGPEARWTGKVKVIEEHLLDPLRWRRARRIFVNSMSDLFHEQVPDEWIDRIFAVMALAPQHTFQILTKRPERMRAWFAERWQGTPASVLHDPDGDLHIPAGGETGRRHQVERACEEFVEQLGLADTTNDTLWTAEGSLKAMQWEWPLPNVWLGVSVEDQAAADERIPLLLDTPAAVRFISAEPLLGPVDLRHVALDRPGIPNAHLDSLAGDFSNDGIRRLNWVIVGGESGPGPRPFWAPNARSILRQCQKAGVACFIKQMGGNVRDRNDAGFDGCENGWNLDDEGRVEHEPDGYVDDAQGAEVRIRLRDRKGGDWSEWPEDLRVREFPTARPV